jgi:hypothetical protein
VFSVFNWRILLGGAASAAILTVGVAAPAFAAPGASTPAPLNGITQGLSGSGVGGIFCALPNLPVSLGVSAAASALGESCSSTQVNGQSQSFVTGPQQASTPRDSGQSDGPAQLTSPNSASTASTADSTPSTSGASSAMPGLNSISNAIPDLGNATSVVPGLGNVTGSLNGNGNGDGDGSGDGSGGGLGSVTGALSGVAGGLSGGGQAGGPATGSLP